MSLNRNAGLLAGLIAALLPVRSQVQIDGDWEASYVTIALIALTVLTIALWEKRTLTLRNAALYGLVWGVSLLFSGALLTLFFVFLAAGIYWFRGSELRRYISFAAVELIVAALCIAPWAIRNEHSLGYPILTRSNPGLELRVSNNDDAASDQGANFRRGVFSKYHPYFNIAEAKRVRDIGEVAYNREELEKAEQWIRAHPRRFLDLCVGRFKDFWFYPARSASNWHYPKASLAKVAILYGTSILGFGGLIYIWRKKRIPTAVLMLILIVYPLPYYVTHVGMRSEYPIHWILILLAAVLLHASNRRLRIRKLAAASNPDEIDIPIRG